MNKEVIFLTEIDYYTEALDFMFQTVNGVTYGKLKDKMISKFEEKERKKLCEKLDILSEIQDKVSKKFNLEDKDIQFFFKGKFTNSASMASILMDSFDNKLDWAKSSVEERKNFILKEYEDFLKYDYDKLTIGDSSIEVYGKRKLKENESLDLIGKIDDIQCTDEERWQLLKVLKDFPKYLDKLFHILDKIVVELKKYSKELEKFQNEFISYWTEYLKENNIYDVIKRFSTMDFDEFEEKPLYMASQFFSCYNITIQGIEDHYRDFYKFIIGFVFYGDFDLNSNEISKEMICSGLKLLGDPSKYELLQTIKHKNAYGQELAKELNLTTATISHHVNALFSMGFIKMNKGENRIYYEMNKETIEKFLDDVKMALLK